MSVKETDERVSARSRVLHAFLGSKTNVGAVDYDKMSFISTHHYHHPICFIHINRVQNA